MADEPITTDAAPPVSAPEEQAAPTPPLQINENTMADVFGEASYIGFSEPNESQVSSPSGESGEAGDEGVDGDQPPPTPTEETPPESTSQEDTVSLPRAALEALVKNSPQFAHLLGDQQPGLAVDATPATETPAQTPAQTIPAPQPPSPAMTDEDAFAPMQVQIPFNGTVEELNSFHDAVLGSPESMMNAFSQLATITANSVMARIQSIVPKIATKSSAEIFESFKLIDGLERDLPDAVAISDNIIPAAIAEVCANPAFAALSKKEKIAEARKVVESNLAIYEAVSQSVKKGKGKKIDVTPTRGRLNANTTNAPRDAATGQFRSNQQGDQFIGLSQEVRASLDSAFGEPR